MNRLIPPDDGLAHSTGHDRYRRALAGDLPAEALPCGERARLIRCFVTAGWLDVEIAVHTKTTTYTTARIRERLGLRANARKDAAA